MKTYKIEKYISKHHYIRKETIIKSANFQNLKELMAIIRLYQKVFGGEPWNEGWICPNSNCGKNFPLDFEGKCPYCGSELQPYYPDDKLKQDFEKLRKLPGYIELIAKISKKLAGIIMGWDTNLNDLNESKFGLSETEFQKLERNILAIHPKFDPEEPFFYFAEVAVRKESRGQKVASKLYYTLLESVKKNGAKYIIVRTTTKTKVPYEWFKNMGYEVVYYYDDDRVILIKRL